MKHARRLLDKAAFTLNLALSIKVDDPVLGDIRRKLDAFQNSLQPTFDELWTYITADLRNEP